MDLTSNIILPYDKKLLSAIADYVLTEIVTQKKCVFIIFEDTTDIHLVKHIFSEWSKVLKYVYNKIDNIQFFSLSVEQEKLDYDSIIDLSFLLKIVSSLNKEDKKMCVLLHRTVLDTSTPEVISPCCVTVGDTVNFDDFISILSKFGYKRVNYVESISEFAVRGSIIDIWPNGYLKQTDNQPVVDSKLRIPTRLVFDNDILISIKQFDVTTQRSITEVQFHSLEIYPVNLESLLSLSSKKIKNLFPKEKCEVIFCKKKTIDENSSFVDIEYSVAARYFGNIELFQKDIKQYISKNYQIIIGYNYDYELNKILSVLPENSEVKFVKTQLVNGFCSPKKKILFITYPEIFSKFEFYRYPKQKIYHGIKLDNIWEIQQNDYVVHREYGIAQFLGVKNLQIGEHTYEFLVLLFANDLKVYIPVTNIDLVEKYISLTNKPPKLSCLDRESWLKTTKRIKESIREYIVQMYLLYTQRKRMKGFSFKLEKELEEMFSKTFEYEETEDQKKAIEDVLSDMEKSYPMDRIIVGDVGFGKTEVALRATFRAVVNGKQVAVLCPTTVLAEQHYRTFRERLEPFGIKTAILTRLQQKYEIENTIKEIKEGKVDVVIGTHILLNDKITFPELGLVIIDEEHKFGVRQKEKIRLKFRKEEHLFNDSFSTQIFPDVLSLTATPIPRTLAFCLEGIKDISLIETPPEGRLPIETFVLPYDESTIVNAISRELYRDGQVYYVFNDISLIEHKTQILKTYFPNVEIEFIHSKLPAKKIEEIMIKFLQQKIQVLVTTTIIEAGLDMPNVNTIIVENVEHFGLAQLYQLRGRVGRRDKKAYCYLLYRKENITGNAKKRLAALLEFTGLGSGYRLALRDLEIRGAGEILGTRQHGFVNEVGLSMYSRIVQQLVNEISGKVTEEEVYPKIGLQINAYIPQEYIQDVETRIMYYRKFLQAKTLTDIKEIEEEINDRFGPCPFEHKEPYENLIMLSKLRTLMMKFNIASIEQKQLNNNAKKLHFFVNFNNIKVLQYFCEKFKSLQHCEINISDKNYIEILCNFKDIKEFINEFIVTLSQFEKKNSL